MVCAYSLCCNIAIHARWIASESNPADAPSRQRWIDAHTTCAPGEKRPATKSRITTAQACLDTAITTRSARSERGGRSPLEDNAVQEAALLSCTITEHLRDGRNSRRATLAFLPIVGLMATVWGSCCRPRILYHLRQASTLGSDTGSFSCARPNAQFPAKLWPSTYQ